MGKENYKSGAKCKYHSLCSLYNNNVLSSNVEKEMCKIGLPVDESYEPEVPESEDFLPSADYAHGPGGTCDAYLYYRDNEMIPKITELIEKAHSIEKILDKYDYL